MTYVTRSLTTGLTLTMRTHTLGVEPSQSQRTPQKEAVVDAYLGVRVGVLHDSSGQGQLNDLDNGQKSLTKRIHKRSSHCYLSNGRIIIEKGNEKFIVTK